MASSVATPAVRGRRPPVAELLETARELVARCDDDLLRELPAGVEVFDAHVHLGRDSDGMVADFGELLWTFERYGISRAFAFCLDEPDREPAFKAPNNRTLEHAARSDGCLIPFVRLDLADDPIGEAVRCLDRGARGIKLHPRAQAFGLDDGRLAAVFAVAAERRAESAQERVERARQKLQMSRNAAKFIQSYEMKQAESQLNELYSLTSNDEEGQENRAWVFYNLGLLNSKLEQQDQAAAFFKSALQTEIMIHGRLGLDSVGTLDGLAHALEDGRNYNAAVEQFEQLSALLSAAAAGKDKYFRLNTANAYKDLGDLYLKQAAARYEEAVAAGASERSEAARNEALRPAHEKAKEQYRKALAIWEEVLRDDPEALSAKYEESASFLQELYYPLSREDEAAAESLLRKAFTLRSKAGTPTARKPIGPPNPGDDPAIQSQLAAEGPGYVLFNGQTENAYGRPELVDLIRAVAAEWAKRHPDLKLVVADLSLRGGGNFPGHGGDHQDGREADIWPLTNNGQAEPTNIYAPNYSRELTKELIGVIRQTNPAAVVYFDDPPLVSAGLVRATLDHNNHMHVLLP
jgi:tetratricopeptide (TPR) repeat protein